VELEAVGVLRVGELVLVGVPQQRSHASSGFFVIFPALLFAESPNGVPWKEVSGAARLPPVAVAASAVS